MRKVQIIAASIMVTLIGCTTQNTKTNSESTMENNTTENAVIDDQSKETMDVAMTFMDAMGKGDMEVMTSLMHEEMVWQNEGDPALPWIGPWNGKEVILNEFLPAFGANFQTTKWDSEEAFSSGNTAAFFGRMVGILTKSERQTKEFTYAIRVKVKDGKVILWNWFEDSYEVSQAYHNR